MTSTYQLLQMLPDARAADCADVVLRELAVDFEVGRRGFVRRSKRPTGWQFDEDGEYVATGTEAIRAAARLQRDTKYWLKWDGTTATTTSLSDTINSNLVDGLVAHYNDLYSASPFYSGPTYTAPAGADLTIENVLAAQRDIMERVAPDYGMRESLLRPLVPRMSGIDEEWTRGYLGPWHDDDA